jgi:glycine/D-amino acid oxidase-like deaminating enzyme
MTGRARHVAILGAGIMGVTTALFLARRGVRVTLFDQGADVLTGTSRWNEGKIHLGYLYANDASGASARSMLDAGLHFRPLIEALIETPLQDHITRQRDRYLLHPESILSRDSFAQHVAFVDGLLAERDTTSYLGPVTSSRALSRAELDRLSNVPLSGGFAVPEYSVETQWMADRLRDAVYVAPGVTLRLRHRVTGLRDAGGGQAGPWTVEGTGTNGDGPFSHVVNALWEGRIALDHALGLPLARRWSHRFRKSVFLRTDRHFDVPSRVFAVGPFGDLKNYDGRSFYVSWYPAGLLAEGQDISPPAPASHSSDTQIFAETRACITALAPDMASVFDAATETRVEGGWVFAQGRGALDDRSASIHQRHAFGIYPSGTYISVDTGKYSTAPLMAHNIADCLTDGYTW